MVNAIPAQVAAPTATALPALAAAGSALSLVAAGADAAANAEVSGNPLEMLDFAAILGQATTIEAASVSAKPETATPAARPASGKPGGKILPAILPDDRQAPADSDTALEEMAEPAEVDLTPMPLPPLAIPVVLAPLPVSANPIETLPAVVAQTPARPVEAPVIATQARAPKAAAAAILDPAPAATSRAPLAPLAAEVALAPPEQTAAPAKPAQTPHIDQPGPALTVRLPLPTPTAQSREAAALPTATMLAARPLAQGAEPSITAAAETRAAPVAAAVAPIAAPGPSAGHTAGQSETPRQDGHESRSELPVAPPMPTTFAAEIAPSISSLTVTAPTLANSPAITTPVTAPAANAPQDLAALVDRLVEARQAAAPRAVEAAIAHADFGRVALRFSHEDGALTVAMTSADPGFAPAVQAATASVPSGLMQDAGSTPQRQDSRADTAFQRAEFGQGQAQGQAGASGNGQSQAQHAARREDAAGPFRTARERITDDGEPGGDPNRSGPGIYA